MHPMNAKTKIAELKRRVEEADRSVWRKMDKAGIASYSYLRYMVAGRYKDHGMLKMEAIEAFLDDVAA